MERLLSICMHSYQAIDGAGRGKRLRHGDLRNRHAGRDATNNGYHLITIIERRMAADSTSRIVDGSCDEKSRQMKEDL